MNNIIGVNVKLTLKDIRKMCIANELKSQLGKINLCFCGFITILIIFLGILLSIQELKDGSILGVIFMILGFLLALIIVIPVLNIRLITMSYLAKKTYLNTGLIDTLQRYEFMPEGFACTSSVGKNFISWFNILLVEDLKPCFLITESLFKFYIIPKRSFRDKEQLNSFYDFLISYIDNKKLKLQSYDFEEFSPDYVEENIPMKRIHEKLGDSRTQLLESNSTNIK